MSTSAQPDIVDLTASPGRSLPGADGPSRPVPGFLEPPRSPDGALDVSLHVPDAQQDLLGPSLPSIGHGAAAADSLVSPTPAKRRLPASFAAESSNSQPKARRLATGQVHKPFKGVGSTLSQRLASVTAYRPAVPAAPAAPVRVTNPQLMQSTVPYLHIRPPMPGQGEGQAMMMTDADLVPGPSSGAVPAAAQRSDQRVEAAREPTMQQHQSALPWAMHNTVASLLPQRAHPFASEASMAEGGAAAASQPPPVPRKLPPYLAALSAQQMGRQMSPAMPDQALPGQPPARPGWQCGPGRSNGLTARSDADAQAALRAAVEGMALCGEGEAEPPAGAMRVRLMRHQRLALHWMRAREAPAANPRGGILADDQARPNSFGLGKTVSTIALVLAAEAPNMAAQQARRSSSEDTRYPESSDNSSAYTPDIPCCPAAPEGETATADSASRAGGTAAAAAVRKHSSEDDDDCVLLEDVGVSGGAAGRSALPAADERPWSEGDLRGGTLVVCPTSVLHQWRGELKEKVAQSTGLSVHVYHGKGKAGSAEELACFGVVLTTYTTMALEAPVRKLHGSRGKAKTPIDLCESSDDDEPEQRDAGKETGKERRERKRRKAGVLFEVAWHRVVLDEAQSIKNRQALASYAAWALQAERRWCLSGTPIQNSVDDLYSYFRFLRYQPYARLAAFKAMLKEPLQVNPDLGARRLRAALQGVLLRRTKGSLIDGQPIVDLPAREVRHARLEFSPAERANYDQLQQRSMAELKALEASSGGRSSYINMLWLLLRLRQACNHPRHAPACHLVCRRWQQAAQASRAAPGEVAAARKLAAPLRAQLLAELERPGGGVCALCGDLPEDPVVATCSNAFCRQCATLQVGALGLPASEQAFDCPACSAALSSAQIFGCAALSQAAGRHQELGAGVSTAEGGDANAEARAAAIDAPSAKLQRLLALLADVRLHNQCQSAGEKRTSKTLHQGKERSAAAAAPEKVVVFSQWTRMLDLVASQLAAARIQFRRLDGSMSVPAREAAIHTFTKGRGVDVLIVSLKAAALGLNLTAANHVVLLDLWWNPSVEEQAIDRCHRIGQARPVHITRITIADTVEDRILALQERKRKLVSAALGDEAAGMQSAGRLTLQDLQFLFSGP